MTTEKEKDNEGEVAVEETRDEWSGKLDFVMSALSFAVGMGNLWRFPYLCYRNGGGAFIIPYVVMMVVLGYPLLFLELSLGQYGRKGIVDVWRACPVFKGIGWGMFCVSAFTSIYYNMTISWCFYYLFASFARDVPWRGCLNNWNTKACTTVDDTQMRYNCTNHNGTLNLNKTCVSRLDVGDLQFDTLVNISKSTERISASEEYFHNHVLGLSSGITEFGSVQWALALCLLFSWILVFISLARGIKVSGKVTYVTAMFPYFVLIILMVRGFTLDGAWQGILYYITPVWSKLLSAKVWGDAAIQVFFSLSMCWGGMITLASYNPFNNNCLRDSIVVATGDMLTSIFSGLVIFAILGYMANEMGVDVSQVAKQGPGLAFVVYPEICTKLPVAPLWCALFMIMLINVGMGSQMAIVSTVQTTICEQFDLEKGKKPVLVLLAICIIAFLLGLLVATNGGIYLLLLMDSYCATYSCLVLAIFECIALAWVYGVDNFLRDIETMIGSKPGIWWKICWKGLTPGILVCILISLAIDFKRTSYGDYVLPIGAEVAASFLTTIAILCVPAWALYMCVPLFSRGILTTGEIWQKVTSPEKAWSHVSTEDIELEEKSLQANNNTNGHQPHLYPELA